MPLRERATPDAIKTVATRRRYVVMAFLCVLAFLTYFDRVCIVRGQEVIQRDLGMSDDQMGLIFGAFWLAYALFELPGGWLGDRYGARLTLTRIVLAWSFFTVLSGSATGFLSLLAFRFLFGAGEAGAFPNMARVQSNWLPARSRGRAGGLLWLLARFGGAFSPLLFGALLRCFDSEAFRNLLMTLRLPADLPAWRVAFWAAGGVGLLWCLAFYPWFRDDPAAVPGVNAAELRLIKDETTKPGQEKDHVAEASTDQGMTAGAWRALLGSRSLWAMGLFYVCTSFGWSFYVSWLPRYLKEVHGVTLDNSEVSSGLPLLYGGISCLVGGVLSDALVRRSGRKWLGRALLPIGGHLIAAVTMLLVPLAADDRQAMILMCIAATCTDLGQGANWATIVDLGGRHAGTAAGFINMVGNSGNVIQPYVGSLIFHALGWDSLFHVYAGAFVAAAAMWLFINPQRPFYRQSA
jgi:ACS family glucarate transporter-like MFS transporter